MQETALFLGEVYAQPSLIKRLALEFNEAIHELRADPKRYLQSAIRSGAVEGPRRRSLFQLGLAIGIVVYSSLFGLTLLLWSLGARNRLLPNGADRIYVGNPVDLSPLVTWLPVADRDAHGGGGGGRGADRPASQGAPPQFYPENPIMAPTTRPTIRPPNLPMIEKLLGDSSQSFKRDDPIPTGLPEGVPGPPSDGPGSNGGVGTGDKGGVGPGEGPGFDKGKGGNRGGGEWDGLPGGRRATDLATAVDSKPIALNLPRPNYTEEARKNKIQGTVRARVLVGSDGTVKQVQIVRGLPDGLNEEAIRAAFRIRFKPAIKDGRAVAYWTTLEVEFNIR